MSKTNPSVLYLGDTSLDTAASYLGAVMKHFDIAFDYVPSDQSAGRFLAQADYRLFILSDYPASNLEVDQMQRITERVSQGSGLLMIGGWESFQGSGGFYHGSVIEEILPVNVSENDDRVNYSYPCVVWKRAEHAILADLPFAEPPCIGGFNRITAKPEAEVLLQAVRYSTQAGESSCSLTEEGRDVLLAVGQYGKGRTASLATDAAPHWVGGFVDWGDRRVSCEIAGAEVEVGDLYAAFFNNLIRWTGQLNIAD
jgi:uncharacterized membrane protein